MQNSQQLSSCPTGSTGSGSLSVSYSAARRKHSQGRTAPNVTSLGQPTRLGGILSPWGHPQGIPAPEPGGHGMAWVGKCLKEHFSQPLGGCHALKHGFNPLVEAEEGSRWNYRSHSGCGTWGRGQGWGKDWTRCSHRSFPT